MLRPATAEDRSALIALALAEDATWADAPPVSTEEAGELIDSYEPGIVIERDGRVAAYATPGILLIDPADEPGEALEALVQWLGAQSRDEIASYAGDSRRIAWLEARGFTHRRSAFDLQRGIDPPLPEAAWPSRIETSLFGSGWFLD